MASIYRRTRSYPIPSGAEIVTDRRGQRFAKWTDRKTGRTRKAPVNADGDGVLIESDKGNTEQHVAQTTRQIQVIIDAAHAEHIGDLDGAAVMRAIGTLRERAESPASLRTCNSHLRSVKSFTRWLWKEKRAADDALAGLSQFNEATDRRHVRRELTPDELAYLLAHVERTPKENFRLSGPVRATAYRVALGTGFRVKELRTLTPASFDLDADPPTATVAAAYSKRRRRDEQPIRPDLAELFGDAPGDGSDGNR